MKISAKSLPNLTRQPLHQTEPPKATFKRHQVSEEPTRWGLAHYLVAGLALSAGFTRAIAQPIPSCGPIIATNRPDLCPGGVLPANTQGNGVVGASNLEGRIAVNPLDYCGTTVVTNYGKFANRAHFKSIAVNVACDPNRFKAFLCTTDGAIHANRDLCLNDVKEMHVYPYEAGCSPVGITQRFEEFTDTCNNVRAHCSTRTEL